MNQDASSTFCRSGLRTAVKLWLGLSICLGTMQVQPLTAQEQFSVSGAEETAKSPGSLGQYLEQVSYDSNNAGAFDPVAMQLADLQSQLSLQNDQINRLRLQVDSPLNASIRKSSRYFVNYESVMVQAVQSNLSAFIVETDDGYSSVMFPWQLEHSPRVEFGVMPADGKLGFRMRYWQFDHSVAFRADDANGLIPAGRWATVGYLSEDGDVATGAAFIEGGDFRSKVRMDVLDWEVERTISRPISVFAGLRYTRIGQSYDATAEEAGQPDVLVAADSEFRGIGPSVAMRFMHQLPLNRLSLFADFRGSLLFGNQEFSVIDSVNLNRQSLNKLNVEDWSDIANSMVSNAEIKFGIQYVPTDWLTMRVALEAQHYGDVGGANPTAIFIGDDRGLADDSPLDDDLGFYGLSVALEAGW